MSHAHWSNPSRSVVLLLAAGIVSTGLALGAVAIGFDRAEVVRCERADGNALTADLRNVLEEELRDRTMLAASGGAGPGADSAGGGATVRANTAAVLVRLVKKHDQAPVREPAGELTKTREQAEAVEAELRQAWREAADAAAPLDACRQTVEATLANIQEMLARAAGRQRIRYAMVARGGSDASGVPAGVREVIAAQEEMNRLHGLVIELLELAPTVERAATTDADDLNNLRDNRLMPSLTRCRRLGAALDASVTGVAESIDALERAMFGAGARVDVEHQTILEGTGGLFAARRRVLAAEATTARLRARHAGLMEDLRESADLTVAGLSMSVEESVNACERSLSRMQAMLGAVLCLSMGSFAGLGVRVARGTRAQFAALQVANDSLSQQREDLDGVNRELRRGAQERERLQGQLVAASRQAGMAEVATGVLHNVGNVLNSVNVAASTMTDLVRDSEVGSLVRSAELIRAQGDDLARFMTQDERGKQLPGFLIEVAGCLERERQAMRHELESISRGIEHIRHVISTQQAHAKRPSLIEAVAPGDLIEDALRLHAEALERHGVKIERHYATTAPMRLDKHRVLQILLNLITNADQATRGRSDRRVWTSVTECEEGGGSRVVFEIRDNGQGIDRAHLQRVFNVGFTTRVEGHGFGLHSAANAAQEMGGSLTAHSDGPGTGATFRLSLPPAGGVPARAAPAARAA